MLEDHEDAYGHAIYDYFKGKDSYEITERDDGFFDVSLGPRFYFSEYDTWPPHEQKAVTYARGKVLDIGCGAGRHSLYLQGKGLSVTGVDLSPLCVEVCRLRGLKSVYCLPVTEITPKIGVFDTVFMFGANFGLFGGFKRAGWLLKRFQKMTTGEGRILAETRDPYVTRMREHVEYHEYNRKRGRMPGQVRLRVHYLKYVTPWFDYVFVSKKEMKAILEGTGWEVTEFIDKNEEVYIAVIEKSGR